MIVLHPKCLNLMPLLAHRQLFSLTILLFVMRSILLNGLRSAGGSVIVTSYDSKIGFTTYM